MLCSTVRWSMSRPLSAVNLFGDDGESNENKENDLAAKQFYRARAGVWDLQIRVSGLKL